MKPTEQLHQRGQSLWLDNITRELLSSGTLSRHIQERAVTGLTSNPTIFDKAIEGSSAYDHDIAESAAAGTATEDIFFALALDDLRAAAKLFEPVRRRTAGVDGWVSLEVSPLLADDADATIAAAAHLHQLASLKNLFIKIPGTSNGLRAIEESIFAGIPVNVTLLFSETQYLAAADAYLRGLERRVAAGLSPEVASVASIFVSRWDRALAGTAPAEIKNRVGIAAGAQAYRGYRKLLDTPRWQRLANSGARAQRLLFASTSTKDPSAPDTLYVAALAAPFTIDTMPEETLLAYADHGRPGDPPDPEGREADALMAQLAKAGTDPQELAERLQREGAQAFDDSWRSLLTCISDRATQLVGAS